MACVACAADQAAKGLRHFGADDTIIIFHAAMFQTPRAVQYVGAGPWNLLHDNQA